MAFLTDFEPRWIDAPGREGVGVSFRCPMGHCKGRVWALFANPLDGGPAWDGDCMQLMFDHYEATQDEQREGPIFDRGCGKTRWARAGETFDTLSLTPSLNMHECGHFYLTNGGW